MASGDVVNGLSATNVSLSFQPAATVECAITSMGAYGQWISITNGVISSVTVNGGDGTVAPSQGNIKLMINNTNYITINANATSGGSYTGIQIK
jgi:hypothetical protein|tara:strand:- start:188 stop:469 length:282 start_codon:yes stop_codon:yes gene_type:complete